MRNMNKSLFSPALLALTLTFLLHGCGGDTTTRDGPPPRTVSQAEIENIPDPTPQFERPNPANQKPYTVFGKTYYPLASNEGFSQTGEASWYGKKFHGRRTANGEIYNMYAMTAAHPRLPLPSYVQVRNLENGRSIIVRVNDRGPFANNRIIDLSYTAARKLDFANQGTARVEIKAITSATAEKTAKPTEKDDKQIYLQIAAFYNLTNAQNLYDDLQGNLSHALQIQTKPTDYGTLYQIQVGPLTSMQEAMQLAQKLQQQNINGSQILLR